MPALEATLSCDEDRVTRQFCAALLFEGIVQPGEPDGEGWHEWVAGGRRFRARANAGAFGRRTLSEGPERKTSSGWTSAGWQDLLDALDLPCDVRDRVHREFSRTAINWQGAKACLSQVRRHRLTGAELESAIIEGHPYHPSFKARTGFSDADNRAFGPEAASPFQLEWVVARAGSRRGHACRQARRSWAIRKYAPWVRVLKRRGSYPSRFIPGKCVS